MGGWRGKVIFLLIVYFAGFATAVYCLAPVPEDRSGRAAEKGFVRSVFKSDEFAQSFNVEMHKCLDLAKDAAQRTGDLIKQKLDERHANS